MSDIIDSLEFKKPRLKNFTSNQPNINWSDYIEALNQYIAQIERTLEIQDDMYRSSAAADRLEIETLNHVIAKASSISVEEHRVISDLLTKSLGAKDAPTDNLVRQAIIYIARLESGLRLSKKAIVGITSQTEFKSDIPKLIDEILQK